MALIVLLTVFVLSRVFTMTRAGSLWFDEAFSVHVATRPWLEMVNLLAFEHNPWGHFLILRAMSELFGSDDWIMRSPSLFTGIATFAVLYVLGKKMFNSATIGLGATFFLTTSTLHLYHQTEVRMYAFVGLFAGLALLFAWTWFLEKTSKKSWYLLGYALVTLGLIHLHLTAWLFITALAIIVTFELQHCKQSIKTWVITHALLFTTGLIWFTPIAWYRAQQPSTAGGWFFAQHEQGYALTHLVNFLLNGESNLLPRSIMALMMIALLGAAFIRVEQPTWWQKFTHPFDREAWPFSFSFHWTPATRILLGLFVLTMTMGFALQITVTKYLISASIPLFLLMSAGLSKLPRRSHWLIIIAIIALVLPMHLRLLSPRHHWDVVAGDVVRMQSAHPEAIILVHSFAYALPLQQYLPDNTQINPVYPFADGESLDEAIARHNWQGVISGDNIDFIDASIGDATTIILVSSTNGNDAEDPVKAHLWQNGWKLVEREHYTGYGDPDVLLLSR